MKVRLVYRICQAGLDVGCQHVLDLVFIPDLSAMGKVNEVVSPTPLKKANYQFK
jgi:hypothetical protein